jgi:hypothetical protein
VKTRVAGDVLVAVVVAGAGMATVVVVAGADATVVVVVAAAAGEVIGGVPSTVGSVVNTGGGVTAVVGAGTVVVTSSGAFADRLASSDEAQPAEASAARATRKKARLSTGKVTVATPFCGVRHRSVRNAAPESCYRPSRSAYCCS